MAPSLDRKEHALEGRPGVMTVWVRYTASTLGHLLHDVKAVAPTEPRCLPTVMDDGIADILIDVRNEAEGVAIVEQLKNRFEQTGGLELVRAQFFSIDPR